MRAQMHLVYYLFPQTLPWKNIWKRNANSGLGERSTIFFSCRPLLFFQRVPLGTMFFKKISEVKASRQFHLSFLDVTVQIGSMRETQGFGKVPRWNWRHLRFNKLLTVNFHSGVVFCFSMYACMYLKWYFFT